MNEIVNGIAQSLVSSMAPLANQATQQCGRVLHQHTAKIGYHGLKNAVTSPTTVSVINGFATVGKEVGGVLFMIARESTEAGLKALIRSAARRA